MKRTKLMSRLMAVLMLSVMLVSCLAVSASADTTATEISGCSTAATGDAGKICKKLQEIYGTSSAVKYSTTELEDCPYSTSLTLDTGKVVTVYLSQKPSTGDIGVQMGDNGKLEIDGITSDDTSAWNQLFSRFKGVIVGITGVGTLVMIVLFIVQFMKLGASAGNPQARSQALTGVLWTGIAAALLGSVTIIVGFFYNAI